MKQENEYEDGYRFRVADNKARFDFTYPRIEGKINTIEIGLEDVRAADNILIYFDFDRDGYVIKMDRTKEAPGMMEVIEEKVEVAFIPAWNTSHP